MNASASGPVLRYIYRLVEGHSSEGLADRELLRRFVTLDDQSAFTKIIRRHGPMVFAVCRRIVRSEADADDAFQAVFLVLIRRARQIGHVQSLGGWLHRVAHRTALRARANASLQRRRDCSVPHRTTVLDDRLDADVGPILDEELGRLPERYRIPLVLCYFEGLTVVEAARHVGCPEGTVRSRLVRGRDRLRRRLIGRGLAPGVAATITTMASGHLTASVPRLLGDTTARLGWLLKSEGTLVKIGATTSVAALVETGTKAVITGKIYLGISAALATAALATGLVVWSRNAIEPHSQEPLIRSQAQATADATRQRDDAYGDPLPPGALVRLGSMRFRHGTQAYSVACAPDGQLIASGGFQTLRLWEAQNGKPLATWRRHGAHVFSVVFSPDGTRLLSVGSEPGDIPKGKICIWDVRARRPLYVLEMDQWMRSGDFSPDGAQFAVTGDAGALLLFDTATGKELKRLPRQGFFEALRFSPDGRYLASTGDEKTLNLWNTQTGEVERQIPAEPSRCVSFSPDGKTLATTHDGPGDVFNPGKGTVCLWDVPTGQKLHTLEGPKGHVLSAAFSPNGKLLAAGGENQVIVWNATTVTRLWDHELTHAWVQGVTFSPDNRTVFAAATDGRVHPWDAKTGKDLMPVEGHSHGSAAVTTSIDFSRIATASDDRTARIWDATTGKTTAILKAGGKNNHGLEAGVYSADFSLDGKTLVTGGGDGSVRLWDVSRGAETRRLVESGKSWYSRAQYSPSGKFIVSGHVQAIRIWDAKSGEELRSIKGHDGYVVDVCFSPNEKLIASIAHSFSGGKDKPMEDRTVRLWDVTSGTERHRFEETYPSYVRFRPDGRVVHWLGNQGIRARDVITGEIRQELSGAGAFAYSPSGQWLATSFEGSIVIRDSQTHRMCRNLGTLPCNVTRLIWAADGRRLVSGQEDSTVLVWDLSFPKADARKFSHLWSDLGSTDLAKAYAATVNLAANGDATVRQIQELIRPAEDDACIKQIRAAIANLDSDEFELREKATEDLRHVGAAAETALVLTFEHERSQETRSRATALLNEIAKENGMRTAESTRSLRALEVLEWIGSKQALDYLRQLAAGAPEAEITNAASSSLGRIGRRIAATHKR